MFIRLSGAILLAGIAAATWAAPALPGEAPSGIRGVVLDTTCYGPCQIDQQPQPYQGSGLTVVVRRRSTGEVVRKLTPDDGHFSTRVRPGSYRVTARVRGECWEGESKRVGVQKQTFSRVQLHVGNRCIV